jgi:hypothetical protein
MFTMWFLQIGRRIMDRCSIDAGPERSVAAGAPSRDGWSRIGTKQVLRIEDEHTVGQGLRSVR